MTNSDLAPKIHPITRARPAIYGSIVQLYYQLYHQTLFYSILIDGLHSTPRSISGHSTISGPQPRATSPLSRPPSLLARFDCRFLEPPYRTYLVQYSPILPHGITSTPHLAHTIILNLPPSRHPSRHHPGTLLPTPCTASLQRQHQPRLHFTPLTRLAKPSLYVNLSCTKYPHLRKPPGGRTVYPSISSPIPNVGHKMR